MLTTLIYVSVVYYIEWEKVLFPVLTCFFFALSPLPNPNFGVDRRRRPKKIFFFYLFPSSFLCHGVGRREGRRGKNRPNPGLPIWVRGKKKRIILHSKVGNFRGETAVNFPTKILTGVYSLYFLLSLPPQPLLRNITRTKGWSWGK